MTMTQEEPSIATSLIVGQTQPDGTIYLGYHEDPQDNLMKDWFTTANDACNKRGKSLTMNFNDASAYVENLEAHGHHDWQLADSSILNEQFNAKNTVDFSNTYKGTQYFSSSPHPRIKGYVEIQFFDKKYACWSNKSDQSCVRPVRGVCRP